MYSRKKLLLLSVSLLAFQAFLGCAPTQQSADNNSERHIPILNPGGNPDDLRQSPSENGDVTAMSAPVTPVQVTNAPPATAYPSLAGVPPTPPLPSKDNIKNDFSSLNAQQQNADANRSNLMNDQSATVMTSPQTGQLVPNAAEAAAPVAAAEQPVVASAPIPTQTNPPVPTATSNETGFTGWLHNVIATVKKPFTGGSTSQPAATETTVAASPSVSTPGIPTPVAAQPGPEPLVTTPYAAPETAAAASHGATTLTSTTSETLPGSSASTPAPVSAALATPSAPAPAVASTQTALPPDATYQPVVATPSTSATQSAVTEPVAVAPVVTTPAPAPVVATPTPMPATVSSVTVPTPFSTAPVEVAAPVPTVVAPTPAPAVTSTASHLPSTTALQSSSSQPASINSSNLPDISQLTQQNESPAVNLVEPTTDAYGNAYLGESRYAAHN